MINRIGFVHTVAFLVETFKTMMREAHPSMPAFHILNESLLQDLIRDGPSPAITRRVVGQAQLAADAGADLIVFTCSSTSPAIDVARQVVGVPILKIDDPMAERAVALGARIGLVCTTPSTLAPSETLLRQHAAVRGRPIDVTPLLVEGAYDALLAGDRDRHDRLVSEAAVDLARSIDVLVLAQASLAHLCDVIAAKAALPVLASPPLLMEAIAVRLRAP